MQQLITLLHILVAISVIALVLIQHGKGADAGAAFGSGASGTMFGSQGSTPFLVKVTAVLALLFFITSGVLDLMEGHRAQSDNDIIIPVKSNQLIPTDVPQKAVPVTEEKGKK